MPYPLPEECLASYFGRLSRISGDRYFISREVLKIAGPDYFSPSVRRIGRLDKFLLDSGVSCRAYENLCLVKFLEPFCSSAGVREVRKYVVGDNPKVRALSYAARKVFRTDLAICPRCVFEEIESLGVSYVKRQHQIRTMAICEQHEVLLESICTECGEPIVVNGFVQHNCANCDAVLRPRSADTVFDTAAIRAFRYMASVIAQIFNGDIRGSLDLRKFASEAAGPKRPRAILALNLASRIRSTFGLQWLNAIELNPYRQPTYSWPAIYVNRTWGTSNPGMELLLACILAEDGSTDDIWLRRRRTYPARWHAGLSSLDGRTVRQLMRGVLPETIAQRGGLHKKFVHGVLHAYPDLERRYWIARKRATSERHRQCILHYIRENPDCTKTEVRFACVAANSYLWQNDRKWWDQHVGHRSGYGPPRDNGRRPRLRAQREELAKKAQCKSAKESKKAETVDQNVRTDAAPTTSRKRPPHDIQVFDDGAETMVTG